MLKTIYLVTGLLITLSGCQNIHALDARAHLTGASDKLTSPLQTRSWIHGSADCEANDDPAIDIYQFDQSSYILRQNKCTTFEAPFIYVFFGESKILILDTGANDRVADFPLYNTVQRLIAQQLVQETAQQAAQGSKTSKEILVVHSHSHSDHYTGDIQFTGKDNVTVVAPNNADMTTFFDFTGGAGEKATIELGGRTLTVLATPGHQQDAIAIYDPQTKWLLTGDTFYPGLIYVKNWSAYKQSIARLAAFIDTVQVSSVLGAHIEMTNTAGEYYPIGTTYQPNETTLALTPEDLMTLNNALALSVEPQKIIFNRFIVLPLTWWQKMIGDVASWLFK